MYCNGFQPIFLRLSMIFFSKISSILIPTGYRNTTGYMFKARREILLLGYVDDLNSVEAGKLRIVSIVNELIQASNKVELLVNEVKTGYVMVEREIE